ncbi:hypothetical protein NDU88_000422 [Pleurodeles waltl]|uniref:Uncharacterized protein n=1 Tax=Pleurodeles waltl TaxID=8319 RepID=A0AAV7UR95_PLEWA|nr:hypothetical protein NDU88_000422 [Pleurodeles waltl]
MVTVGARSTRFALAPGLLRARRAGEQTTQVVPETELSPLVPKEGNKETSSEKSNPDPGSGLKKIVQRSPILIQCQD